MHLDYLDSRRPDFIDYKTTSSSNPSALTDYMFVTALYKVHMLSGHSTAKEIKHLRKFASGFIGHQIPKAVLFHLAKFLLEAMSIQIQIFV